MNTHKLAQNLAVSLAGGTWTKTQIGATLKRRLPSQMQKYAAPLALYLMEHCPQAYAPPLGHIVGVLKHAPAFRPILRFCRRRGVWPAPDLQPAQMAPLDPFKRLDLPALATLDALAQWLLLPPERLAYFADPTGRCEAHGEMAINHYHYHVLTKPGGGKRLIEAPKPNLKAMQRKILRDILQKVPTHPSTFGFVAGKDCRAAAIRHTGEAAVLCFDLRDFFPSISGGRVFGLFRSLGYPHRVASYLTGLCTTRTPQRIWTRMPRDQRPDLREVHLPQGAPTSPALSNLVAYRLDVRLSAFARRVDAHYSRYADDLTFSGDLSAIRLLKRRIPALIADEGFRLNRDKTRLMRAASRQVVTGLVVNQHLNVDRRSFDRLKAIIHACAQPDDERRSDPAFLQSLSGQIAWVASVHPRRGEKLCVLFDRALATHTK